MPKKQQSATPPQAVVPEVDAPQVATTAQDDTSRPILRWLPLAGAVYAVLQIAGDLVINAFPDENTPLGKLTGTNNIYRFTPQIESLTSQFAKRAILSQPLDYVAIVGLKRGDIPAAMIREAEAGD